MDDLEIRVEISARLFNDRVRDLEGLEDRLHSRISSVLGISARIKLVEPNSIPRSEGKAKRVVDKREI
jgi:phenylacetate-CoA ligase